MEDETREARPAYIKVHEQYHPSFHGNSGKNTQVHFSQDGISRPRMFVNAKLDTGSTNRGSAASHLQATRVNTGAGNEKTVENLYSP